MSTPDKPDFVVEEPIRGIKIVKTPELHALELEAQRIAEDIGLEDALRYLTRLERFIDDMPIGDHFSTTKQPPNHGGAVLANPHLTEAETKRESLKNAARSQQQALLGMIYNIRLLLLDVAMTQGDKTSD